MAPVLNNKSERKSFINLVIASLNFNQQRNAEFRDFLPLFKTQERETDENS